MNHHVIIIDIIAWIIIAYINVAHTHTFIVSQDFRFCVWTCKIRAKYGVCCPCWLLLLLFLSLPSHWLPCRLRIDDNIITNSHLISSTSTYILGWAKLYCCVTQKLVIVGGEYHMSQSKIFNQERFSNMIRFDGCGVKLSIHRTNALEYYPFVRCVCVCVTWIFRVYTRARTNANGLNDYTPNNLVLRKLWLTMKMETETKRKTIYARKCTRIHEHEWTQHSEHNYEC